MSSPYKPQQLKEKAAEKMLIVETAIEVKALVGLLEAKGIVAECEMEEFRKKLRASPDYRFAYENAKKMVEAGEVWEKNPKAYLQALWKAKLDGLA